MTIYSAQQVGKMYGGTWIFQNIEFELGDGETVAVVGRNGSGKTTLLRLLAGIETADVGEIHVRKNTRIGYLSQMPNYPEGMTVREALEMPFSPLLDIERKMRSLELLMTNGDRQYLNEYAALQTEYEHAGGYAWESTLLTIAGGLGLTGEMMSCAVRALSGGEQTKVGLATTLLGEPDILLLDEPTNHLDLQAVEWLEGFLARYGKTVVIVSHDRYFLDKVATRVMEIDDGEIQYYQGNYTAFVEEKERRLLAEFQAFSQQQKRIRKMEESIRQLRDWANRGNPPNAGLHRRASSMEKALNRIKRLKRPQMENAKMAVSFTAQERSGTDVIVLENIHKSYASRLLLSNIDMHVRFGERVAIVGANGSGKSTLLKIMMGEVDVDDGLVKQGSRLHAGYLSQRVWDGDAQLSVLAAFRDIVRVDEGTARNILAKFLFYGAAVFRRVGDLSGGERVRLRLAQLVHQDINLLILDEPTNHLDIESREVLEDALADFTGTIVAVSHDRYFLNKLFDHIYWLADGKLQSYLGDYDAVRMARDEVVYPPSVPTSRQVVRQSSAPSSTAQREKRSSRSIEAVEKLIAAVEADIAELDRTLYESGGISASDLAIVYTKRQELDGVRDQLYQQLGDLI